MLTPIILEAAASVSLDAGSIAREWVLEGEPATSAKAVAKSRDKNMWVTVWHCTPGIFNWHYAEDEVAYIISGEVFVSAGGGAERRLRAGDVVLFPAGSSCRWRVTEPVKKVAVLHKHAPRPLSLAIRAWNKCLSIVARRGRTPMLALLG